MSQIDTTLKGFQNPTGHNNCFLNVGLQSLWHLAPFHLQFVAHKTHFHDPECCLFCSLKLIFDQYKYGDSSSLPPTVIRNDLSFLFARDSKFQLGQLDDAAEALESLLGALHQVLVQKPTAKPTATETCEPPCLVHRVFGIDVVQQTCCSQCAATSEPFMSNALIDYVPVAALRAAIREAAYSPRSSTFSDSLRRARSWNDQRKCTNEECGKQAPVLQYLITRPDIYSVGLVWESDETPASDIMATLDLIGLEIDTRGLYHQSEGEHCIYKLKGMICYYGKHYIAYFYSPSRECWVGFDDVIVSEVGPHWSSVLNKCKRGKDQPALLFYEKVQSSSTRSSYVTSPRNGNTANGVTSSLSPRNGSSNMNGNGTHTNGVPLLPPPRSSSKSHTNGIESSHSHAHTQAHSQTSAHSHAATSGVAENGKPGPDIGRQALARNNSDLISFAATAPPVSTQPHAYQSPIQPTFVPLYANYSKYLPDNNSLSKPVSDYAYPSTKPPTDYSARPTTDTSPTRLATDYLSTRQTTDYSSSRYTNDYSPTRATTDYTPTRPTYDYLSRPPTDYSHSPTTPPYDYSPTRPSYGYSATRSSTEELSLGQRVANKISQKVHLHSSKPAPTTTLDSYAPGGGYNGMHSLASSRAPTVHTSPNYSATTPNPLYYRSPGTAVPTTSTPYGTNGLGSTSTSHGANGHSSTSTLRNGSPYRQRNDPFSSLLSATMPSTSTPATTFTSATTPTTTSATRGISPAHQRPPETPQYVSTTATRGLSPAHQRPAESSYVSSARKPSPGPQRSPEAPSYTSYSTPTTNFASTQPPTSYSTSARGVSPAHQRPVDLYSNGSSRGLSASRSSAYPPPPTLNSTPAPTTRGVSPQRGSTDTTIPTYSRSTIAPPPSSSKTAMRSTAPARYTTDPSSSSYSSSTRNPSPTRQPTTISTTPPSTTTAATIMAKLARNASPTRTQPTAEPSSLYSRMDKSSTAAQLTRDNLDRGLDYSMQHLHLNDQVKPIPVSAPPPRYTSPKRSYPATGNLYPVSGTGYSSSRDVPKLAPPPSPSSLYKSGTHNSTKKSVHFQTE